MYTSVETGTQSVIVNSPVKMNLYTSIKTYLHHCCW